MLTNCEGCKKEFECPNRKYNFNTKNSMKIYCSNRCYNKHKSEKHSIKINCANCGKEIHKPKAELKQSKTGNLYCSRSCSAANNNRLFKKWENHPSYKNGKSQYRNYKLNSIENKICKRCGFDNILALEVHHIDRNRKNNKLENLEILCCNCHRIEHRNKNENVV